MIIVTKGEQDKVLIENLLKDNMEVLAYLHNNNEVVVKMSRDSCAALFGMHSAAKHGQVTVTKES